MTLKGGPARPVVLNTAQLSRNLLDNMLTHIANSPAIFKSQQIDDPEINEQDKVQIAENILFQNPVAFLTRFGNFLLKDHLALVKNFTTEQNKYDVEYHINKLQLSLNEDVKMVQIRNRRYEALKRLQQKGSYFSETEMEKREPLLYYQLVGQYLTDREKFNKHRAKSAGASLSGILINQAESEELVELRQKLLDEEAEQLSSSDDDNDGMSSEQIVKRWGDDWEDEKMRKTQANRKKKLNLPISREERQLLLQEFETNVFNKFMNGLDAEFDYRTVDDNPEYDCLHQRSLDEEEKYFDEETLDDVLCTDTGVEDY